jgi:hypothetical protein
MMKRLVAGLGLAALALGFLAPGAVSAAPAKPKPAVVAPDDSAPAAPVKPAATIPYGHVYLIRGIGNFLSHGIDTFETELKARGVPVSIYNHRNEDILLDDVTAGYRKDKGNVPIIIIGHSLGANAAILLSNKLGDRGIPVRLVVTFDHVLDMPPLTNNAAELIDYYKPPFGHPTNVVPGFKGPVMSTNLEGHADVTHDSIDKTPAYHQVVLDKIMTILKKKPKPAAKG